MLHLACVRVLRALCALILVILAAAPLPALAQTAGDAPTPPTLRITAVDVSQFPVISLLVYGENLGAPLDSIPIELTESGAARVSDAATQKVGYQVALVFDASNNVALPGVTGAPRIDEFRAVVKAMADANLFADDRDWLTFISLDEFAQPRVLGPALDDPWEDYDFPAVWNSISTYRQPDGAAMTPLNDLVRFAVEQFKDPDLPPEQQRHLVVFSDGTDLVSVLESQQVVGLANEAGVRIHTVQLGQAGAEARRTLQQYSQLTGGIYTSLDDLAALLPIQSAIVETSEQLRIGYVSQRADPGELRIVATLPGGKEIAATARAPAVDVQPVAVTVLQPPDGAILERSSGAWDAPLDALAPAVLPVQLGFQWPDGRPRILTRVEIEVGGKTTILTEPPFDGLIEAPVALLGAGDYTVRARALDEVGLTGESAPVRLIVTEVRPPEPTATPTQTPTPTFTPTPNATATVVAIARAQATATAEAVMRSTLTDLGGANADLVKRLQQLSWITLGSAGLALLALIFAIYVLSSRERRKRATEIVTGTLRSVTEPFMRGGRKAGGGGAHAQLALVDNGGSATLPLVIPLQSGSIRIGRDPSVSNVVLDDRRISRFHCQIREEMGGFRLLDEGSTSGTYVNDVEVGIHGQPLQPNDLIGIGPVAYRFEATAGGGAGRPMPPANGENDDSTVPLIPRAKP